MLVINLEEEELIPLGIDRVAEAFVFRGKWNSDLFATYARQDLPTRATASRAYYYYRLGLAASFFSALRARNSTCYLLTNEELKGTLLEPDAISRRGTGV